MKWAVVALALQGVIAAQEGGALSTTAGGRGFVTGVAPRTEPKVEANRAGRALWIASVAALGVANIADARSSWSKNEGNRVLAEGGGTFGAKGAAIKGGINAVWIAGQMFALPGDLVAEPGGAARVARPDTHGVGHVGGQCRITQGEQERERDEASAARHAVDDPGP